MSCQQLLEILADGEFHSGEALGHRLGISRAAVWKQIQKIDALDIPLVSVKGKGYRIEGGLKLLNEHSFNRTLTVEAKNLLRAVGFYGVVNSTNDLALLADVEVGEGVLIAAEQQVAGRGRRGRHWLSPYGSNLYFSLAWRFSGGAAVLEGLSLAVGVIVAQALQLMNVTGVGLKWPNDVLLNGQKLAGILLEMSGDAEGPCKVVVGVGINIQMPEAVESLIDQPWADLTQRSDPIDKSELLAHIINLLLPMLAQYQHQGFSHWRSQFNRLDAYAGYSGYIKCGNSIVIGEIAGVTESGALELVTDEGVQIFHGGEVSLRKLNDSRV
jgi:BirA family biotin operon repressor/biotin-[acetyl-CoA-carboxylase] ligase